MFKNVIKVPYGVKFISEWRDYDFPRGNVIVDKGVTGCGYTEYCLSNQEYVVLCSPRKMLLENKGDQHTQDPNILYLENDAENFVQIKDWGNVVSNHILKCEGGPLRENPKPVKFMITYDSLHHLVDILRNMNRLDEFTFVVDEFQSIFLDAYFKASTEFDFVETLQGCENIIYLSATPMLDKYLEKVPEFKDLPFYQLDWSESGYVENVLIRRKISYSLSGDCGDIVEKYRGGQFPVKVGIDGSIVESKEAVFFFNSISDIIKVINKQSLRPEEVNVLCANTPDNEAKLKRAYPGKGKIRHGIGKIPLKGETNKMFTFCTRSVYIGADFYSDNASTYIFADPNIESLALDISLDLPQIAGRQRNNNNPFKNSITIYYRILDKNAFKDRNKFDELQAQRRRASNILLEGYDRLTREQQKEYTKKLISDIQVSQYSGDFISISKATNLPVYNNFIELASERAWDVSREDYQDQISVTKALTEAGFEVKDISEIGDENITSFLWEFENGSRHFTKRLKLLCEFMDKFPEHRVLIKKVIDSEFTDQYSKFYDYYGTSGCKAKRYREKDLEIGMRNNTKEKNDLLRDSILSSFDVGEFYDKKYIKSKFKELFSEYNINESPKASTIENYFDCKATTTKKDGKWINGFKIISKK